MWQVLVEAETGEGLCHSILLQNAETVRLIGPSESATAEEHNAVSVDNVQDTEPKSSYCAISVTELKIGSLVYLHLQGAARHTGISINETIIEK